MPQNNRKKKNFVSDKSLFLYYKIILFQWGSGSRTLGQRRRRRASSQKSSSGNDVSTNSICLFLAPVYQLCLCLEGLQVATHGGLDSRDQPWSRSILSLSQYRHVDKELMVSKSMYWHVDNKLMDLKFDKKI